MLGIKVKECSNNNNNNNKLTIINIAVPAAQNILTTEEEKVERYQDLALEIKRNPRATRVIACVQTSPISFLHAEQRKKKTRETKKIGDDCAQATRVTVIPIVIGALGTLSKNAKAWNGRCPRRETIIISAFQWLEKPTGTPEVRGSNPLGE